MIRDTVNTTGPSGKSRTAILFLFVTKNGSSEKNNDRQHTVLGTCAGRKFERKSMELVVLRHFHFHILDGCGSKSWRRPQIEIIHRNGNKSC